MGLNLTRLPFQLCNIGAFFFIVCIPLKLEKMFYFCGIANVVGGLVACFALDEQGLIFEFWKVHYFYEHTLIIAIPILVAALGIFPKMTPKKLKYFFIGFTAYFFFCLISGTILNGISDITGRTVNYFFLFDADTALGFFPFMEFIRPFVFKIGKFTFYPGLQITVYIGFQMFCMLYFGVLQLVSKLHDTLVRKNQNSMQTL